MWIQLTPVIFFISFKMVGNFLTSWVRNAFSRKNLLYEVSKINFDQVHHYTSRNLISNFLVTENL
jgi:hypothetical protein